MESSKTFDKVIYKFGNNINEFIAEEVLISDSDNQHNIGFLIKAISK